MCGDLKQGQTAHFVCVRLDANETDVRIQLGRRLEHVSEVFCTQYCVVGGNGANTVWNLEFKGNLYVAQTSNKNSGTWQFPVPDSTYFHLDYNRPQLISNQRELTMENLTLQVRDGSGAAPTFTEAVFYFTIICDDPSWSASRVMATRMLEPRNAQGFGARPSEVGPGIETLRRMMQ